MRSQKEMITLFLYLLIWIFTYKISDILFKKLNFDDDKMLQFSLVSIVVLTIAYVKY
jgi:hypothetical protein